MGHNLIYAVKHDMWVQMAVVGVDEAHANYKTFKFLRTLWYICTEVSNCLYSQQCKSFIFSWPAPAL